LTSNAERLIDGTSEVTQGKVWQAAKNIIVRFREHLAALENRGKLIRVQRAINKDTGETVSKERRLKVVLFLRLENPGILY
jgi:hypothetical protein